MNLVRANIEKNSQIEVEVLKLKLNFSVHLHFAFQNNRYLYLVEDYCENGDLETLIQWNQGLTDEVIRIYTA